ncbi:MAG: lysylphosphatidylglycerol synthase transmembrane domain-containing protein [Planctomycetota bacterium]
MRATLIRYLARGAGIALIAAVLWLAGFQDRVVDAEGNEHRGRVESRTESAVLLQMDEGLRTIPIRDARDVRLGLLSTFATLAKRPGVALLGLGLHIAAILAILLRWHLLLRGADLAMPYRTVLRLGWIGQFFSNVLPGGIAGGDVVKALYLTRAHPRRKARAVVTIVADRALGLVVLCAIALVALLFAPAGSALEAARATVLWIALGAAILLVLFYSSRVRAALGLPRLARRLPFRGMLDEIGQALVLYARRPRALAGAGAAALVGHALILAAFAAYGRALGDALPAMALFVAIPVAQILAAVPGLPGGWGVGDFAFFICLPAVGVPPGQAVALSITYRVAHTLISLPGGLMLVRAR